MDRQRQPTPRAAVIPHTIRSIPHVQREGQPQPLRSSIHLSTTEGDYTLYSNRVLIGRSPHCRVVVLDPLVSREHALIRITKEDVVIEDLRSANGVYVNNIRIFEPQQLFDGDRILVGTNEVAVFASAASMHPTSVPVQASLRPAKSAKAGGPTERADALDVLGRLADRMLAQGLPQDAERVMADHLRQVLQGARMGLPIPVGSCAQAARYALLFAASLHNGNWIDYAVELHLRAQLPMTQETIELLKQAAASAKNVDHALYGFYVEWLREAVPRLPPEAGTVLAKLERLHLG